MTGLEPKGGKSDGPGYLLVDCRPFIAYNVSHIKGAINVNCCNRLNRKRLQMGKATLADLATTKEGKEVVFYMLFLPAACGMVLGRVEFSSSSSSLGTFSLFQF